MKTCFRCGTAQPLSEYYAHPMMADGHLNKCKTCTKSDTAARVARKQADPDWVIAEARRCSAKASKYHAEGRYEQTPEKRKITLAKHRDKYPEKNAARTAVSNAVRDGRLIKTPCIICGNPDSEGHHDDYSKPLDVKWLCPKHHGERHVELRDIERRRKAEELAILRSA
jgi:hypothetical protein